MSIQLFHYPTIPHLRRHGPRGYRDYSSYKPWLRDGFQFACVYCLCRESHIEIRHDGEIRGLTVAGKDLIRLCQLARSELVEFRRAIRTLYEMLENQENADAVKLKRKYFGYPQNLPNITNLRPPGGNQRPPGIASSYYELRVQGELPQVY